MAASLGGRRKFFKVLLPGTFESCLWLPPKFAAGLEGCPPGIAAATLRDPTGRSWRVDLDHRGGSSVCFAGEGWRRFVSGCGLSAGHFLVFDHLAGGLDFAVDPFDASGCSLDISTHHPAKLKEDDDDTASRCHGDTESGNGKKQSGRSRSPAGTKRKRKRSPVATSCGGGRRARREDDEDGETVVLRRRIGTPHELQCLDVSMGFCESLGWTTSRAAELVVVDTGNGGERRRWEVGVNVAGKGGMILRGWAKFAKDNKLRVADACVFRPVHVVGTGDRFLQVQFLRGQP